MHACMHTFIYIDACIYTYICAIREYEKYKHTCKHMCMHARTQIHTHTYR